MYEKLGLPPPTTEKEASIDKEELIASVRNALYASKICSYAQARLYIYPPSAWMQSAIDCRPGRVSILESMSVLASARVHADLTACMASSHSEHLYMFVAMIAHAQQLLGRAGHERD